MDMLCRTAQVVPANFHGALPPKGNCVAITFDDAFESVSRNALPELARRSFHSTIFVPVGVIGQVQSWFVDDASLTFKEAVMTAIRLKLLSPSLVTLGSHSINHLHLPELDSKEASNEIKKSRLNLTRIIGRKVTYLLFRMKLKMNLRLKYVSRQVKNTCLPVDWPVSTPKALMS